MATDRNRDASVERMLRQSLRTRVDSASPSSCLDAETLAGWVDGTLNKDEFVATEEHLSDCSRCQALVAAMAKTTPSAPASKPWWRRGLALPWLVPLTAAATAIVIWIAVPYNGRPPAPEQTATQTQEVASSKPPEAEAPAGRVGAAAPVIAGGELRARADKEQEEARDQRANATQLEEREVRQESATPTPTEGRAEADRLIPTAPPPERAPAAALEKAPEPSRQAAIASTATPIEIVSPDPSIRWRVGAGGMIQYSANSGSTWELLSTGVVADLTAGSSPSPSVCWVVGRAGTIVLSTDGRRWQRVSFPELADLAAVRAIDVRSAEVTTADGRTFSTTDGGLTWTRR